MRGISWVAEELIASQECLCCMQFFLFGISTLEDEDITLWQKVGFRLSSAAALYPRRMEISNISQIDKDC
jgi:hypothetical protein